MSHVSYTETGSFETSGPCPASHPVKLPQLMFEVIWDTSKFNDKSLWPADGTQPFVLSMGDATGYGQHADYIFGWEGTKLQDAIDANCFGATCKALTVQPYSQANKCVVSKTVTEQTESCELVPCGAVLIRGEHC